MKNNNIKNNYTCLQVYTKSLLNSLQKSQYFEEIRY